MLAEIEIGLGECRGRDDDRATELSLWLRYNQAFIWYLQGKYHAVLGLGEQMLEAAERLGGANEICASHSVMAWSYMGRGVADAAIMAFRGRRRRPSGWATRT